MMQQGSLDREGSKQGIILRGLSFLAGRIVRLNRWVEAVPGKWLEGLALGLYALLHLVMAVFHEPWYDEAVAWQVARCVSVPKLLTEVPHYEGHPALWHLILVPFAKSGMPYEASLSIVSLVFTAAAVWMILYRSPFPRLVKLLLPFTFFFFYQYGVVSRPYCMMMLAMVLLAHFHKTRNEKPGAYVFSMVFLCLTSAYGILIAGCFSFLWVLEITEFAKTVRRILKREDTLIQKVKGWCKDRRVWMLAGLLLFAICLMISIIPGSDTLATNLVFARKTVNKVPMRLFYTLFMMPADVLLTSTYMEDEVLVFYEFDTVAFFPALVVTALLFLFVYWYGRRKNTFWYYMLPHCVFAVFVAVVYGILHHIGIDLFLILYWLWITMEAEDGQQEKKAVSGQASCDSVLSEGAVLFLTASVLAGLYWNGCSSGRDIATSYSTGRDEAAFLKEYQLDQKKIMVNWYVADPDEQEKVVVANFQANADNVLPYFDRNIFYNVGHGEDALAYSSHRLTSDEENEAIRQEWLRQGAPDVLYGMPDLEWVFGDTVTIWDYALVWYHYSFQAWKDGYTFHTLPIFLRRDLLEETGLEEIEMINYYTKEPIQGFYKIEKTDENL